MTAFGVVLIVAEVVGGVARVTRPSRCSAAARTRRQKNHRIQLNI
jgi:hypothetical protein